MAYNPISSPRSSQRAHHANGLNLLDINQPPIAHLSPSPSLKQRFSSEHRYAYRDKRYSDGTNESDDEWDDIDGVNPVYGVNPNLGALRRPSNIRRESQDVDFGSRVTPTGQMGMRGRPHGWEVNVRLPHMKGLSRGKTALMKTLRGGLRKAHVVGHHHTPSKGSPPFEFRDPQPAPQSIRQQYAELAPSDSSAPAATSAATSTTATVTIDTSITIASINYC